MQRTRVVMDFETRSDVDLLKHGRMRYVTDPSADILMMGYKYVVPGQSASFMWFPGDPLPDFVKSPKDFDVLAHNAEFEWAVTNFIGKKRYGFAPTTFSNYTCTMALCGRYGLPQALEKAGEVLKLKMQKNPEGKLLIKLFCTPVQNFGRDAAGHILPSLQQKWLRFIQYCHDDVAAEYELLHTLPADHLSESEQATWIQSCLVNARGIPVDVPSVKLIRRLSETYREAHFDLLPELTGNVITKISQTKRIVKYVNEKLEQTPRVQRILNECSTEADKAEMRVILEEQLVLMPNCQSDTVLKMLERDDLPDDVLMLLEMRAALGLSSIGKYVRFEDMEVNERCYDNQRYYGAHTGRWTGGGVQLLNLPRATVKDPVADKLYKAGSITAAEYESKLIEAVETEIEKYRDGSIVDGNPVKSARALIRPMIKASEGKCIGAADYSAIEYVVLEWFAGDTDKLIRFANGADQYIDQAAAMYSISEDAVNSEQRRAGKVVVLGCGYGQGAKKLIVTADKQWGMKLTLSEAEFMVKGYRSVHRPVTRMWYKLKDAALNAIQQPGVAFSTHKVTFKVVRDRVGTPWLSLTLPTGRVMYYNRPYVDEDSYGLIPCHWGFHQVSKNWIRMKLIPGRITENVVQATARDILVYGMRQIEKYMGEVIIWSVYDEVVCELEDRDHEAQLTQLCNCMCMKEDWAREIPLRADGFIGPRYKKM